MPSRTFIPFNFSAVLPFDVLSSALNKLSTLQPQEPYDVAFDHSAVPSSATSSDNVSVHLSATPSVEEQLDMHRLMISTVRDEEWRRCISQDITSNDNPPPSLPHSQWINPFSDILSSNIQQSFKRSSDVHSPMKHHPAKRPRPFQLSNATTSQSPPNHNSHMPSRVQVPDDCSPRQTSSSPRRRLSHAQERRRLENARVVDRQEVDTFVEGLRRFVTRSEQNCQPNSDYDSDTTTTGSLSVLNDIRQNISLFSARGAIGLAPVDLLRRVILFLQKCIRRCRNMCEYAESNQGAHVSSTDASVGVVALVIIVDILSAPKSPRCLLVEELLEDVVDAIRLLTTVVLYPLCDPLYMASKKFSNRFKARRDLGSVASNRKSPQVPSSSFDELGDAGRSSSRSALRKPDLLLLDHFRLLLDSLTSLCHRETFLPESFVSQCSMLCIQLLSVGGSSRLQSCAIKLTSTIFEQYPPSRVAILDNVREAVTVVPSSRKYLRTYNLAESQRAVRGSSALVCILLCASSNRNLKDQLHDQREDEPAKQAVYLQSLQSRHHQAVNFAVRVVDPLFARACSDKDGEFRTAFLSFFEDMLNLYGMPEWPSVELILQTLSVSVITKLRGDDEKGVYARALSIDVLGSLASKMCTIYGSGILSDKNGVCPLLSEEAVAVEEARKKLLTFLDSGKSFMFASANAFAEAMFYSDDLNLKASFGKDLARGAKEELSSSGENDVENRGRPPASCEQRRVQKVEDVNALTYQKAINRFDVCLRGRSKDDVSRTDASAAFRLVGARRSFARGFNTILESILDGMHDQAPTIRSKSIKALSAIDEACGGLLQKLPQVLPFIEDSCRDVSTLTRDAALDLLSRSLLPSTSYGPSPQQVPSPVQDPDLVRSVFEIVLRRLCDSATSVRKRAISITRCLLSDALRQCKNGTERSMEGMGVASGRIDGMSPSEFEERIVRICTSLVARLDDPENSVRDAAEKVLRYALFGFDVSSSSWKPSKDCGDAPQLARRLIAVFVKIQSKIHNTFMSRVVHKVLLVKERGLLSSIVSSCVEHMLDLEEKISDIVSGRELKSLPTDELGLVKTLSIHRVACSSVVCAFGSLDALLVEPHCRSLSPAVKGVVEGSVSEADLATVQRVLKVLEIGLGHGNSNDVSLVDEVIGDVEVIVCQSPTAILEEASVRCLCALAEKSLAKENESVVTRCASTFKEFLDENVVELQGRCVGSKDKRFTAMERNGRCALVRLGLLSRYGSFEEEFVLEVYRTLSNVCGTVARHDGRGLLAMASVRALSHFLIRHRTFLTEGTKLFVSLLDTFIVRGSRENGSGCLVDKPSLGTAGDDTLIMGVRLSILQGFHDLLRDEEDRNVASENSYVLDKGAKQNVPVTAELKTEEIEENDSTNVEKRRNQPELAAEEDAEAGFLALSAQAMLPHVKASAESSYTPIRRTVGNVLGLLVRQGLLLPATVVPCLFTLLLDRDVMCHELAMRVVTFLADRHSSMLTSAVLPALRSCFQQAHRVLQDVGEDKDSVPSLSIEAMKTIALDSRTGHSLLSGALMSLRRDQRRGLLENIMKEFDPRVVASSESGPKDCSMNGIQEDVELSSEALSDDDVFDGASTQVINLTMPDSGSQELCPLATLYFLAITLASLDYTDGSGVGGSLNHGGGTAAAEGKLRIAQEDVTELVAHATRIISNSGQAILRVAKQVCTLASRQDTVGEEARKKKSWIAVLAARLCLLLKLKHHLKVARWRAVGDGVEEEHGTNRMAEFEAPSVDVIQLIGWKGDAEGAKAIPCDTADSQLQELKQLMRNDAIDESDVSSGRRGKLGPGRVGRGRVRASKASSGRKSNRAHQR